MQAYLNWRTDPETGSYSATVGPFEVFIYPEERLYLFHREQNADRCIADWNIADFTLDTAKDIAADLITAQLVKYLDQAQDLRPATAPDYLTPAKFLGNSFRLFDAGGVGGIYIRNQTTGDILHFQPDIGVNMSSGYEEAALIKEINGRLMEDPPAPAGSDNWTLWQEDDDPLGSYYTLNVWPLTLAIDPHWQKVTVQVTDIDQPVAERTGFNSLDEARAIALELATSVLFDWLTRTRQAILLEKAPVRAEPAPRWQFEQYGDADDPADGYYRRQVGPLQLAIDPTRQDVILDIIDPDFTIMKHGFDSLDQAKIMANQLLAATLSDWQSQSDGSRQGAKSDTMGSIQLHTTQETQCQL